MSIDTVDCLTRSRTQPKDSHCDKKNDHHRERCSDHCTSNRCSHRRLTLDMSGGWRQAKLAGRRPLDGRVRRLMEQSLFANHERQFATPHCARHELLATETAHEWELLLDTKLDAPEASQARAEGWCRPRRASNAGGALAHGRRAERALRVTLHETPASRTSARTRTAPKPNSG